MYTENALQDSVRFVKACASNLLARFAPAAYVRLTQQTGRGNGDTQPDEVADYFWNCFHDYGTRLGLDEAAFSTWLQGKRVLEYGPGDVLGAALLFYAHGAASVVCIDRFPLQNLSPTNEQVYRRLIERLPPPRRERASAAFVVWGEPASGLKPSCIDYRVTSSGLVGDEAAFELVVSRAVLEHVNSLEATLRDVERSLAPGGVSIHNVDLRSHNLDRWRPFDFLTWPEPLYRLMYSRKGFPNRWRPDTYRLLLASTCLRVKTMEPTGRLAADDVARIQPRVARPLRGASSDDLSWLGFWMVLTKEGAA